MSVTINMIGKSTHQYDANIYEINKLQTHYKHTITINTQTSTLQTHKQQTYITKNRLTNIQHIQSISTYH